MTSRRISWLAPALLAFGLVIVLPGTAQAQDEEEVYEDLYETEEENDNFALGLGLGLVRPDGDGEIYFGANFRIRVGDRGDDGDRDDDRYDNGRSSYNKRHNSRHNRGGYGSGDSDGIRAYLEPEIGYWTRDDDGRDETDLLLGVNLIGVIPTRNADFYLGVGFGLHFTDVEITTATQRIDESDERLGGNLQVGVDINLSDSVALFGQGRIDILEDQPNDRQTKVWVGARFKF